MPHGESWFSVLFPGLYASVQSMFSDWSGGHTWVAHSHVEVHHVLQLLVALVLLFAIALVAGSKVKDTQAALIPDDSLTVRTFGELFVGATYGMMSEMMGRKAAKHFLPLIGTCAFVIFFSNYLGLVPGFSAPTDSLNTTAACALIIFFATHIYGVKEHGLAYFKHFFGPVWWLAPLIFLIELISHLVRPLTLAVRLAANMIADHAVLLVFLGIFPFLVPLPVYMLGAIVMVVQTLVFCLLSTVYISLAIAHEDH